MALLGRLDAAEGDTRGATRCVRAQASRHRFVLGHLQVRGDLGVEVVVEPAGAEEREHAVTKAAQSRDHDAGRGAADNTRPMTADMRSQFAVSLASSACPARVIV